jgi:hypothetical protein
LVGFEETTAKLPVKDIIVLMSWLAGSYISDSAKQHGLGLVLFQSGNYVPQQHIKTIELSVIIVSRPQDYITIDGVEVFNIYVRLYLVSPHRYLYSPNHNGSNQKGNSNEPSTHYIIAHIYLRPTSFVKELIIFL